MLPAHAAKIIRFVFLILFSLPVWADYSTLPQLPNGGRIRSSNLYYHLTPRIAPADARATIVIQPLFDHVRFRPECKYELTYTALDQVYTAESPLHGKPQPVQPEGNRLTLSYFLAGEQEHMLFLEEIQGEKRRAIGEFHLYSLKADLLTLRPLKGDFHMHSNLSDGVESPAYVAGACRRAGLDWMALSDHRRYAPSIDAQKAFAGLPVDLRIYPGEEVHSPDNPVHVIAFGHTSGIGELYLGEAEAQCRSEVAELMKKLPALPPGVDAFHYASNQWVTEKIRQRGGLAMLCHPYWVTKKAHNIAEPLLQALLQSGYFDLLEVISGASSAEANEYDENMLQIVRYTEDRANGLKMPAAGISDAHGAERSEMFGRFYTVAFSPTADLADLQKAMKSGMCTAVEHMAGERPLVVGPFRLAKYTLFLLREVFPQHDELCLEEGRLMIRHSAGDTDAVERLRSCRGQVKALYDRYWASGK